MSSVFLAEQMPKPDTTTEKEVEVQEKDESKTEEGLDAPWRLILYNDEVHTFEEVIHQLIKALGCTLMKAEELTHTVHTKGKATVFEGTFEECFEKNTILQEIQLITEIKG
ncbi:MAG: ATP-dependent Clp protease adaptor ClpS [Bacteroidota bacterium]